MDRLSLLLDSAALTAAPDHRAQGSGAVRCSRFSELLDKEDDELPAEQLRGMLTLKRRELEKEKREMEERLLQVEARLRQLEHENEPSPYETLVKSVPALRAALLSQKVPHVSEMGYFL